MPSPSLKSFRLDSLRRGGREPVDVVLLRAGSKGRDRRLFGERQLRVAVDDRAVELLGAAEEGDIGERRSVSSRSRPRRARALLGGRSKCIPELLARYCAQRGEYCSQFHARHVGDALRLRSVAELACSPTTAMKRL